ncbi:MAG: aminotransferase class I/II-fold pyridoxal phosphate-dependent enzyme [bacterium]|nr:aminotransferase class I/II-fold pyridoxal phosphate-dependent enzyme [bacterium]
MKLNEFKLEEYLGKNEFTAPYLLCCSDAESFSMQEIIEMGDQTDRKLWDNLRLGYTEIYGLSALRSQIINNLYPALQEDNILCFAGAEDGIFCALSSICESGDHAILLTPCYQSLYEIPTLTKTNVSMIPLQEENHWRIDIDDIKKTIKHNTKCIIINFPHNPTGQIIKQDELDELIKLCDHHGIWLFSDEVYRLLGNPVNQWARPAAEIYPRALSLGVMSKAFGMAGLRIGWIACQNKKLLSKIEKIKHYTSICNSAPSEIISLIVLKNIDKILARNNDILTKNLKLLDSFFEEYKNLFSWVRPQGGCVGFVNYKNDNPVDIFCAHLLKEKGVLLMPASIYDYPGNHFRIGFGRRNMTKALERLKEYIK